MEKTIAIIAIVLVALSFVAGSGFLTGAAISSSKDFYIKEIVFPAKLQANMQFKGEVTFVNTGSLPATAVIYDFRVWDSRGVEYYRLPDSTYTNLLPGENKVKLPTLDLPKADTYKVQATIDFYNRFEETDEKNNIYEVAITVF